MALRLRVLWISVSHRLFLLIYESIDFSCYPFETFVLLVIERVQIEGSISRPSQAPILHQACLDTVILWDLEVVGDVALGVVSFCSLAQHLVDEVHGVILARQMAAHEWSAASISV